MTIKSLLILCLMLSAVTALPAQEKKSAAEAKLESIMNDLRSEFRVWQKEQMKKMEEAKAAAKKAKAEGKEPPPMPAMSMRPPKELFVKAVKKTKAAVAEFKGTEGAMDFYAVLIQMGRDADDKATAIWAADTLVADHIKSEKLGGMIGLLDMAKATIGKDKSTALIDKIGKESPHASVRAEVILAPLRPVLERAPTTSAKYKDAKAKALAAAEGKPAVLAEVKNIISGRENLVAGGKASDIEGVDLDGTAFKLSDYKGKIILLDFWGDWWGPCRALYDHERSLVNEMKNRPFALIGVNSDRDLAKIREIVKKKNLNWRSFQNQPEGAKTAISAKWAVRGWPTMIVIDENMNIHYRGHNGDEAITKAKDLVTKLEAKKKQ